LEATTTEQPLVLITQGANAVLSLPDAERAARLTWLAEHIDVPDSDAANALSAFKNELENFIETDEVFKAREAKIADAHALHSELCTERTAAIKPFALLIATIKVKLKSWLFEQERQAAAEKARIDAENRRKEEARRLEEAQAAQDQGAPEAQVEAILEAPIVHTTAPIQKPKITGFRTPPKRFKAELVPATGKMTLIKAVACVCGKCKCKGNPALLGLVEPNMTALNQMANAQKENLNLPGVKAVPA
jgi:hypothetical protein